MPQPSSWERTASSSHRPLWVKRTVVTPSASSNSSSISCRLSSPSQIQLNASRRGGRYTEIDPPRRLAFTWLWDDHPTRQLIELDFEEADGVTTVRFTHSGLWDEEAVRSHEAGWSGAFDNLERALAEA